MEKDIFVKYARYIMTSVGTAAVFGSAVTYRAAANPTFTGFSLPAFVQAFILFLVFSVLLCAAMARVLTKVMNRKSVVERLREAA